MVEAAELAAVFVEIVVAGGKAARRIGQRDFAPGKKLGFDGGLGQGDGGDFVARKLGRCHPAVGVELAEHLQGGFVVDIQAGAGHNRDAVFAREFDRAHIVGFDFETLLSGDFAQALEIGLAFKQNLRRQHNLFTAFGQVFGQAEPVGKAHFLPARADGFAQIDDVERGIEHLQVKLEQGFFLPEKLDGTEREFHVCSFAMLCYFAFQAAFRAVWT